MSEVIDFNVVDEHGPQTYRGTYVIPALELAREEATGDATVEVETTIGPGDSADEYVANGTSRVTAELGCSRCLEPYPFANTSAIHVRFRPRPEISPESEEIEITDKEELDVEFYSERVFPLRNLAVEQLQLAIPMKPLCDEGCLGLCATCGANKSRETCSCETSIADERWGALADIREQLSKKKNV